MCESEGIDHKAVRRDTLCTYIAHIELLTLVKHKHQSSWYLALSLFQAFTENNVSLWLCKLEAEKCYGSSLLNAPPSVFVVW